jgi:hypothetical protein
MLGKDMPMSGKLLAVGEMSCRGVGFEVRRQRLGERAVHHLGRLEHESVHRLGEGRMQRIGHQSFGDLVAASRVMVGAAGHGDHRDGRGVRGRCPIENLGERRQRRANLVAKEARHADPSRHAQQAAQRDRVILVEGIRRNLPRGEPGIDVGIEGEALLIEKAHRADRDDEFRQGRRLKQRAGRCALAIGARKCDAILIDQRDAGRGNVEGGHRLCERELLRNTAHVDGKTALDVSGFRGQRRSAEQQTDGDNKKSGERAEKVARPPQLFAHPGHPQAASAISRARVDSSPRTHSWHSSRS